jgi:hypothetical protein
MEARLRSSQDFWSYGRGSTCTLAIIAFIVRVIAQFELMSLDIISTSEFILLHVVFVAGVGF